MRDFDLGTNRLGKTPDAACYHRLLYSINQSIIHSLTLVSLMPPTGNSFVTLRTIPSLVAGRGFA
jgi:hypothetical protein